MVPGPPALGGCVSRGSVLTLSVLDAQPRIVLGPLGLPSRQVEPGKSSLGLQGFARPL